MVDPPPYSAAGAAFGLRCLPKYIHYNHYPKLCLVSSSWRDVFQSLLWSQPDRYFSTENRSANSTPPLWNYEVLMGCSRISEISSCVLYCSSSTFIAYHSFITSWYHGICLYFTTDGFPCTIILSCTISTLSGLVSWISHIVSSYRGRQLFSSWINHSFPCGMSSVLSDNLNTISIIFPEIRSPRSLGNNRSFSFIVHTSSNSAFNVPPTPSSTI